MVRQTEKDGMTDSLINRQTDKKRQTGRQDDQQKGGVCGLVVGAERGRALFMWLAVMLSKYSC